MPKIRKNCCASLSPKPIENKMKAENQQLRLNEAGYALLKKHEGLALKAYLCPAGKLTIGYGHTENVKSGDVIDAQDAEALLEADVELFERGVARMVEIGLNENQFSALVCFTFNVGLQAFYRSTLLNLLNRGWMAQVPAQLRRWTKAGGKELAGLKARRRDEIILWNRV